MQKRIAAARRRRTNPLVKVRAMECWQSRLATLARLLSTPQFLTSRTTYTFPCSFGCGTVPDVYLAASLGFSPSRVRQVMRLVLRTRAAGLSSGPAQLSSPSSAV